MLTLLFVIKIITIIFLNIIINNKDLINKVKNSSQTIIKNKCYFVINNFL